MSFSHNDNSFFHYNETQRNIKLDQVNAKMIENEWLADSLNVQHQNTTDQSRDNNHNHQFVQNVN